MKFEWDAIKVAINFNKPGVNFEEKKLFYNPLAAIFDDLKYSQNERSKIIIGHCQNNQLLLASHAKRANAIRIISPSPAHRKEREDPKKSLLMNLQTWTDELLSEHS